MCANGYSPRLSPSVMVGMQWRNESSAIYRPRAGFAARKAARGTPIALSVMQLVLYRFHGKR